MTAVILTSPQCGGTHAFIALLKALGMKLSGRHRDGMWYPIGLSKRVKGMPITADFQIPIRDGDFITGHSAPFPTDLPVLSNRRDPRNIALCHWKRRRYAGSFVEWLKTSQARKYISRIPRHWRWNGSSVLEVWYEEILREETQRKIAQLCGVMWRSTNFYGHGKTWSGQPSNADAVFDAACEKVWRDLWDEITHQSWDTWWVQNGRAA